MADDDGMRVVRLEAGGHAGGHHAPDPGGGELRLDGAPRVHLHLPGRDGLRSFDETGVVGWTGGCRRDRRHDQLLVNRCVTIPPRRIPWTKSRLVAAIRGRGRTASTA